MVANITGVKAIVISIFTTMELLSGIKDKEKQKDINTTKIFLDQY